MPKVWQVIRKSFRDSYDYLGLVLAGSLGWFVLLIIPALIINTGINPQRVGKGLIGPVAYGLAAVALVFLTAPATAGVFQAARKIVRKEDPSALDFLDGFRKLFLPSVLLFALDAVILAIIAGDLWFFYMMIFSRTDPIRYLFLFMLIITVYAGLMWILGSIYHWPLLVEQGGGVLRVQKKAFLLALDNLVFTFIVAFVIMLLTALLWRIGVGAPLLFMGMVSIFESNALSVLFLKYGLIEPEQESVDEGTVE